MNENMMNKEFETLKAQMDILKEKLAKQEIVREQHLRNAIKGKLGEINRIAVRMILIGLFATIYCTWMLNHYGYSIYLQIGTILMLVTCNITTYVQHKNLLKAKELSADLVKETFDLVRLKRRYGQWLWFAVPMVAVWLFLMVYETLYVIPIKDIGPSLVIGIAVGALVGGIIGLRIHFRTLRKVDEMLKQIDEINKGN